MKNGRGRSMSTQTEASSVSLLTLLDGIQRRSRVMQFLLVLSMLLGATSVADAQAPPNNTSTVLSRQLRLLRS